MSNDNFLVRRIPLSDIKIAVETFLNRKIIKRETLEGIVDKRYLKTLCIRWDCNFAMPLRTQSLAIKDVVDDLHIQCKSIYDNLPIIDKREFLEYCFNSNQFIDQIGIQRDNINLKRFVMTVDHSFLVLGLLDADATIRQSAQIIMNYKSW